MRQAQAFGSVLARIREEQGHATAHAFYKSVNGRRTLGLAYVNYLNIEQGKNLPKPERLRRILAALGLNEASPQGSELVRTFMVSLLGSEALLSFLAPPKPGAADLSGQELAQDAARQALTQRAAQFSMDQWRVIAKDPACFGCYHYLVNTPGWAELGELGRAIGLSPAGLKAALQALAKAGIVELSGGRARSPYARRWIKKPALIPAAADIHGAMYKYRQEWIDKRAKLADLTSLTVRLEKNNLERYQQQLRQAVSLAAVYGDNEKTEGTAIYLVEGRVYAVFP